MATGKTPWTHPPFQPPPHSPPSSPPPTPPLPPLSVSLDALFNNKPTLGDELAKFQLFHAVNRLFLLAKSSSFPSASSLFLLSFDPCTYPPFPPLCHSFIPPLFRPLYLSFHSYIHWFFIIFSPSFSSSPSSSPCFLFFPLCKIYLTFPHTFLYLLPLSACFYPPSPFLLATPQSLATHSSHFSLFLFNSSHP